MRYYYYPLCSRDFTFENIFSSESISPPSVYPKREFGIGYFYSIPHFHHKNALVLFTEPPVYETGTDSPAIKFILAISEDVIDVNDIILVDEGIIACQKTIYLTKENFKLFFFSEKEKKIVCLTSQSSLSTKGLKKYEENLRVMDYAQCKKFDTINIAKLNIDTKQIDKQVVFDRKYNYLKGYLYGVAVGIINSKTSEEVKIKSGFQKLVNSFAELRNRFESISSRDNASRYARPSAFSQPSIEVYEKNLKTAIVDVKALFFGIFPAEPFSENSLVEFLQKRFGNRFRSKEAAQQYVDYKIIDDEISGTNYFARIKSFFFKNSGDRNPSFLLEIIEQQADAFVYSMRNSSEKTRTSADYAYDQFKEAVYELNKFVDSSFLNKTRNRTVELEPLQFNFFENEVAIGENFRAFSQIHIDELALISNLILKHTKSGKGEARKEQILEIVEKVGDALNKSKGGRSTQLYQYLNNEVNNYSIEKATSVVMKNFVAFAFNPDSIEKLEGYLETKMIEESWIAYAFWCSFNGFANISRNFVKPIFETDNQSLQNYLDRYLQRMFSAIDVDKIEIEPLVTPVHHDIVSSISPDMLTERKMKFYRDFLEGKYPLTVEQFEEAMKNKDENLILDELKIKFKIKKTDGKRIVSAYNKLVESGTLFE